MNILNVNMTMIVKWLLLLRDIQYEQQDLLFPSYMSH